MKISEYPSAKKIVADDIFLLDGTDGTRIMKAEDLMYRLLHLGGANVHRSIFRGKQIGTTLSAEQRAAIQAGTFEDLWLGDYWFINGVNYRIADFNYWYGKGDQSLTTNHLVIVPDTKLATGKMNSTNTTTGGYTGSEMRTTNKKPAETSVTNAFGENVLTHREFMIGTVSDGRPTGGTWEDSKVDLMTEPMVFGHYIYTPANDGTTSPKRASVSQQQLALFAICPQFINAAISTERVEYWLQDVCSAEKFAKVSDTGICDIADASSDIGIRPVFAIG